MMRVLLDTQSLIRFLEDDPRLSPSARQLAVLPSTVLLVSIASLWEMAIKVGLGKLRLARPFAMLLSDQLETNDITVLNISLIHLTWVADLPLHHRDPFDRLLVAQSLAERIPVISNDRALDAYSITRLWSSA